MNFYCSNCKKTYPLNSLEYKCRCGGLFKLEKSKNEEINISVSLGEIETPIIKRNVLGLNVYFKMDYMMPTGSFKDRGAFAMINKLKEMGIDEVVEDSSGNAGASIAAYCAAAGIKCNIYLPENTSEGKIKQIKAYGSNIIKVKGTRDDTSKAILKAATKTYYASHVYNPLFFEGTKSMATEIYNQIGVPDYIFVPVGNGTMLLGAYLGFLEIGKLPKIIAVQASNCSPIYCKYRGIAPKDSKPTLGEGIGVGTPMRIDEIIEAVKQSGGDIIIVGEEEITKSLNLLWEMGIYVEPTSATVLAGALGYFDGKSVGDGEKIILPLTGTGLKKG